MEEDCVSQEEESLFRARAMVMHDKSDIADESCQTTEISCSRIKVVETSRAARMVLSQKRSSWTVDE